MYKSLHEIPNPYKPFDEIKNEKLFVSRQEEIRKVEEAMETYLTSRVRKNFVVIGDKSLGKSSLLHQLKNKFLARDFLTVIFTLTPKKTETELIFFKELFDALLNAGEENEFLNEPENNANFTQYEIWESLTTYGEHESGKAERHIFLADIYANALNHQQFDISLSETKLIKDFRYICNEAQKSCYKGLTIMIDELQQLSNNDSIIQLLLQIMQNTEDIIFILCGDNRIKSESFEKILRHTEQIEILPFYKKSEIINMIYKPLGFYGFTREEINEKLDFESLSKIFDRRGHNPYHINLILYYMFEKFRLGKNDKIRLDSDITNEVINSLKNIATHHERITAQLNACDLEQLEAFRKLFLFQNINLYDIALLILDFQPIQEENLQIILQNLIRDLCLVEPLNLFKIYTPQNIHLNDLKDNKILPAVAADIKYEFIGDSIDSLYASYIIESTLKQELAASTHNDFIKLAAEKLFIFVLKKSLELLKLNKEKDKVSSFVNISLPENPSDLELDSSMITEKISQIDKLVDSNEEKKEIDKSVQEALHATDLLHLSKFSNLIRHKEGFYFFFLKAQIRHKVVFFRFYIPYHHCAIDLFPYYATESFKTDYLKDYKIEILDSVILNIRPDVVLFVQTVDTHDLNIIILRNVYRENYDEALRQLDRLNQIEEDKNRVNNNIGFVHLIRGETIQAKKYFDKVVHRQDVTYCNLAYLNYIQRNPIKAHDYLKSAQKLFNKLAGEDNKFAIIHQILVQMDIREKLPKFWDLAYEVSDNIIINGNLAILASFDNKNHGFKFLREAKLNSPLDICYNKRFEIWLNFNLGDYEKAYNLLEQLKNEIPDVPSKKHLEKILEIDTSLLLKYKK